MNSFKAPNRRAELDVFLRREGLLSFLVASPMALLGCPSDEPTVETEAGSSGSPGTTAGSTGAADSGSTGAPVTSDDTTAGSSGSSGGASSTGPLDGSSSSGGSSGESSDGGGSSDDGGETTTDGGQGNTCERVGDLMDSCFGGGGGYGFGYWYEYDCNWYITYWISEGDIACAQAYNDVYSCIADLECADVFMGVYQSCVTEWNAVDTACDWGGGDTFGDSGVIFIIPDTDTEGWGWTTGDWSGGTSGGWGDTGLGGTDTGWGGT